MSAPKIAFVSYSSAERALANRVCEFLESTGCSCWIAPRDVTPGQPYGAEILAAIRIAAALVVLLSTRSVHSPHVRRELEAATSSNITLVPIICDDVHVPDAVRYYLGDHQRIDATSDVEEALRSLKIALGRIVGELVLAAESPDKNRSGLPNPANLNPRIDPQFALIETDPAGNERVHQLAATRVTAGRGVSSDIVIPDSRVSRSHFGLNINNELGTYDLIDFGALNGLFLNGARFQGRSPLDVMDLIRVGDYTFEFTTLPVTHASPSSGRTENRR
jgi:hypothetical protein